MKQENKELLIKDLSARLQYNVKILADIDKTFEGGVISTLKVINLKKDWVELQDVFTPFKFNEIRPYLRPMSSLTEEEMDEVEKILGNENIFDFMADGDILLRKGCFNQKQLVEFHNFLCSIHVDFMGLIEKGLAIEVTEDNNPYKS